MADDKLTTFKVGDIHKPRVESATQRQPDAEVAATMGFARIEELLDKEPPLEVGQRLAAMLDALAEHEAAATTPKAKSQVKKGRAAVERTIDLLDYLFRIKEAMQKAAAEEHG